jgi:hypothetical protein
MSRSRREIIDPDHGGQLQRHAARERAIGALREPDAPHAALAELALQPVRTDAQPGVHLRLAGPQTVLHDACDALLQQRKLTRFRATGLRQQATQGVAKRRELLRERGDPPLLLRRRQLERLVQQT